MEYLPAHRTQIPTNLPCSSGEIQQNILHLVNGPLAFGKLLTSQDFQDTVTAHLSQALTHKGLVRYSEVQPDTVHNTGRDGRAGSLVGVALCERNQEVERHQEFAGHSSERQQLH